MAYPQKATYRKPSRVVCALCGDEFATSAEHEEHKKIVHNTMDKKTTLSGHHGQAREPRSERLTDPRDLEPADSMPTTELPSGAENNVSQHGGSRPSGAHGKSRGAGK